MSRFYRALQEASRSIPDLGEKSLNGDVGPAVDLTEPFGAGKITEIPSRSAEATADRGETDPQPAKLANTVGLQDGLLGIPTKGLLDRNEPLIPNAVDPAVVEAYGRLRAKIIQDQERKPFRSLMITSPTPGDGKTVTAINLALSLGLLPSYRVLLVDGDLRRGRLAKALGLDNPPGLANLIEGTAELEDVVLKCDEIPVYFMTRGSSTTPLAELLYSPRLIPQLRKMAEHFSLVLIDSPPVNLVADAQMLAAGCDAVLLVARAFSTTRKGLQKAVQELSSFRIIGTLLNRGMRTDLYRHYKYY